MHRLWVQLTVAFGLVTVVGVLIVARVLHPAHQRGRDECHREDRQPRSDHVAIVSPNALAADSSVPRVTEVHSARASADRRVRARVRVRLRRSVGTGARFGR